MTRILVSLFSALLTLSAYGVDKQYEPQVQAIIELFKQQDREGIADRVVYPLAREKPLPGIQNQREMMQRFGDVFDPELIRMISESTTDDWESVGWRGIMFGNGLVWLDTDGSIRAVNHQSQAEKKIRENLISRDKLNLHSSLRNFAEPVLEWRTARFRIRIDALADGSFRYAAWSNTDDTRKKPDIVLRNGKLTWDGSGGNHYYTFSNGTYKYRCYVIVIGTGSSPPGNLEVYNGNKLLLSEDVVEVFGD